MERRESAIGVADAFSWKVYSVRRSDKARLLRFVVDALEMRGCTMVYSTEPDRAPFYLVFDTPAGERQGLLVYAFNANSRVTGGRPVDEHRFQIKYGKELKGVLDVALDDRRLVTTVLIGIDLERGLFVAVDPGMNSPSPMSRSVEFKRHDVDRMLSTGWAAWERDRREGKTKDREKAALFDMRTEVVVGGRQDRLLDLINLERIARGRDPGERHLIADKLAEIDLRAHRAIAPHSLTEELEISPEMLFDVIERAPRLKMAVRGWVAEEKLLESLRKIPGVSDCHGALGEGRPDVSLRWKGSAPLLIECKNVLRKTDAKGDAKVDFQRTRASIGDPCSRYYQPADFTVLAACLHSVTEQWEFRYALTDRLPAHPRCAGRIASNLIVKEPLFTSRPDLVFDICSGLAT